MGGGNDSFPGDSWAIASGVSSITLNLIFFSRSGEQPRTADWELLYYYLAAWAYFVGYIRWRKEETYSDDPRR